MTPNVPASEFERQENIAVARLLDETAALLEGQHANPFLVRAYRQAAEEIRGLEQSLRSLNLGSTTQQNGYHSRNDGGILRP